MALQYETQPPGQVGSVRPGAIKKFGTNWAFGVSVGSEPVLTVARPFANDIFKVVVNADRRTFACDDVTLAVDAIRVALAGILEPMFKNSAIEAKRKELEELSGKPVRLVDPEPLGVQGYAGVQPSAQSLEADVLDTLMSEGTAIFPPGGTGDGSDALAALVGAGEMGDE
jgi:hypothetical protein